MRVCDQEEAIELANDSEYGLGSKVWTRDVEKGFGIARRMQAGSGCVDDMSMTWGVQEAPFGGLKHGGVGQVNAVTGLGGDCPAEPILIDRSGGRHTARRHPHSAKTDAAMQKFTRWQWGTASGRWPS